MNNVDPSGEIALTIGLAGSAVIAALISAAAVKVADKASDAIADIKIPKLSLGRSRQREKAKEKAEEREKEAVSPPPVVYQTYYHITSLENALAIQESGTMMGNRYEAGLIFAWKMIPDKKVRKLSGASQGVVISFKTTAAFEDDPAFDKYPEIKKYYPVRSVSPGPIAVKDVRILG